MINVYKMPFGKFKGLPMSEAPTSYLEWLEESMLLDGKNTSSPMMGAIRAELIRRDKNKTQGKEIYEGDTSAAYQ